MAPRQVGKKRTVQEIVSDEEMQQQRVKRRREAEQVAKTAQVRAEYKARMVKGMVRKLLNSNYCNLARVLHATLAAEPDIVAANLDLTVDGLATAPVANPTTPAPKTRGPRARRS